MDRTGSEFLEHLKYNRNYSDQTIESYRRDIEKFQQFLADEEASLNEVDVLVIRNFLTRELNDGISKRSCKRRLSALRLYYEFMVDKKYVNNNPFVIVASPKIDKTLPKVLRENQIEDLLSKNKDRKDSLMIRDQAILETLYYTGVRASELINITLQDINFIRRFIRIIGKGNKERYVPFTEDCRDTIQTYLKDLRPNLINRIDADSQYLFLNSDGKKLTRRGLDYILDTIEEKTGLFIGLHPHLLRHTFATELLNNGASLLDIQELMGHASLNATQVYTHVSEEAMKKTYMACHPRAKKK